MSIKNHLKSLSFFKMQEASVIIVAMIGRKLEALASRYNLIAKTNFDFYQRQNVSIKRIKNDNLLSFISKLSGKKISFKIRRKTTDIVIFDEILLNGEYLPAVQICRENKIHPAVIIGSSVIFFKDVFPHAEIICIEPEKTIFFS